MVVTFHGVRGSVPWSSPGTSAYGANTPCVEVRDPDTGAHLILDAGTGIVGLTADLLGTPGPVSVALSHYHWDHTQGLPFFEPLYAPGWQPALYVPALGLPDHSTWLTQHFAAPHFPVVYDDLPNPPTVHVVDVGRHTIGGFTVSTARLSHPGGALAYRVHGATGDVVYATDHGFGDAEVDEALCAFSLNAAAVIIDAHFTPDELVHHRHWGHSSWRQVADFGSACGAGHVWLFHHKPGRTDDALTDIVTAARRVFPAISAAREGCSFTV